MPDNKDKNKDAIKAYKDSVRQAESGGSRTAKAPTSSATGLYQFTEATWKEMEKKLGKKLDIFSEKDQELAMSKLTELNVNALEKNGIPVTPSNLYMTHFLGVSGGPKFLKNLEKNPNELASKYVSAGAVKANANLFFNKDKPVTAAELYNNLSGRLENVEQAQQENTSAPQYIPLQEVDNTVIESTSTQRPRLDNIKTSNRSTPKQITDTTNLNISPVDGARNILGLSGNLDFLPSDINLAFSEEEQLNNELANPDELINIARNGGKQDIDPPKKDNIDKFYQEYLSSPKYKERLLKQGYTNPNQVVKDRLKNFNEAETVNIDGVGSQYYKDKDLITLDSKEIKQFGFSPNSVKVHEKSHSAGSIGVLPQHVIGNEGLNAKEINSLNERNKLYNDTLPHDGRAQELKADIDTLRYSLKKDGIYNTGTQNFNSQLYDKAKKQYSKDKVIQRAFNNTSKEDLIWLMNNIASNEDNNNNINMAKNGGNQRTLSNTKDTQSKVLTEFNTGGSHEANKYGGIPQGIGPNGKLNTVEEGETKFNNYVFSDTLKINDNDIETLFLPKEIAGKTFAEASEYINSMLEDNPNDKIIKRTVEKQLDSLTLGNEKARLAKEKLDINLGNTIVEETEPVNEMFLGGVTGEEIGGGLSALSGGLNLLSQAQGNTSANSLESGMNGAMAGAQAGLAFGPLGSGIGGALGLGAGLLGSFKAKDEQRNQSRVNHNIASSTYQNDFATGGDLTGIKFRPDELNPDPNFIPNLDTFNTQFNLGNNFSYPDPIGNINLRPDVIEENPTLSPSLETYATNNPITITDENNYNPKGKNYMQYAPVLGDILNFAEANNANPEVERLNTLSNRFVPDYVDEAYLQNTVNNTMDNTVNALTNATNGSQGALRDNILAAGLNRNKGLSDAYFRADDINRQQNLQGQQFNLGIDQFNIGQDNQERDINARNRAAVDDRRRSTRDTLFRDLGAIGREQTYDNRLYNLTGGYDSMGDYNPERLSFLEQLGLVGDDNKKRQGGMLSLAYYTAKENNISKYEKEFNNRYK